ncbi:uncharacterized protein LOC129617147 [Condylostylus longicornis]|uniref:uncharacterized protein LOC129617147 n=1 Tax=Condylostylus longicornis TaxID=2530218 RepID=UPI00244E1AED|nr:uncharacterized protein LOC129617147 [Condylostylus longicornis]
MREHLARKQTAAPSLEETDLIMCSSVVNLGSSIALNRNAAYADLVSVMEANPADHAIVSDVDHQLLLKINFKDPVTCTSVCFRAETPPAQQIHAQQSGERSTTEINPADCSGPKTIKCFANLEDLDFVDTETANPAQLIELSPQQL